MKILNQIFIRHRNLDYPAMYWSKSSIVHNFQISPPDIYPGLSKIILN